MWGQAVEWFGTWARHVRRCTALEFRLRHSGCGLEAGYGLRCWSLPKDNFLAPKHEVFLFAQ